MKVVILAGGKGTRLSEETIYKPKPMVEINNEPILMHIIKHFISYGLKDFIILAGYKQQHIKQYFNNYFINNCDIEFDTKTNSIKVLKNNGLNFKVSVIDTGLETLTGSRIVKALDYLDDEFILTYGDGVSNLDLHKLIKTHKDNNNYSTISVYKPNQRFGVVEVGENLKISKFLEKQDFNTNYINIGYMILKKEIFIDLKEDNISLEKDIIEKLAIDNKLHAYIHEGFWQNMDSKRDQELLENLYRQKGDLWKI